ncbi:MAG: lipopolysaccharide kinase InaA family protein [Candidatus Berkiellales bacterium]
MTIISHQRWNKFFQCQAKFFTPHMQAVMADCDAAISTATKILKDDHTSTVALIHVDGKGLIVKRSNTKGKLHVLRRSMCSSRASRNWHYANLLIKLGLPTFEPVAYLEERFGPFRARSYLICTYIEGINARHFFASDLQYQAGWSEAAKNIGDLLKKLAECRISHRDLNLNNIILSDNKPFLIDLDSMCRHRWRFVALRRAKRERRRFLRNWQHTPQLSHQAISLFESIFKPL